MKSVSLVLVARQQFKGIGAFPQQAKWRRVYTDALLADFVPNLMQSDVVPKIRNS
jgi:hypothetical protein